jgi:hypothetical protein
VKSFREQFGQLSQPADQLSWLIRHRFLGVLDLLVERDLLSPAVQRLAQPLVPRRGRVSRHWLAEEQRVMKALAQSGRCLALKGCLLAYLVYPAPDQRWRSDLDVLVPPDGVESARAALRACGYSPLSEVPGGTPIEQESWVQRSGGGRFVVDLHWAMRKHPLLRHCLTFEEQWQASVELPTLGAGARGQGPAHALLNAALHWFDVIYAEPPPLGWLLDQDLLWRSLSDQDRHQLAALAIERGVAGLLGESLHLTRDFLDTPISPDYVEHLVSGGRRQPATRLVVLATRPFSAFAYALWCEPGLGRKIHRLSESLFPPPESLRQRFPGGSRLGLPGLYLRRWVSRLPWSSQQQG